ncbi:hypothetical protein FEM03_18460 [Phragmitibacter flavus]|uniref:Uncharacterized protein n=1 Tax=Phragmitibacter flavus TaxID=2576071 RepID=A0A5R8KAL2_9BACT|nr:hypothetical protein [Phragmitibacter flavus]TLD69352.1 hypothetical protein FEM03_18460 [Phragmitibacter flavus]
MKTNRSAILIVTVLLVIATVSCLSAPPPDPAIEMKGSGIILVDGTSSYIFAKDGTFRSDPLGMSGRTFTGNWKIEQPSAGSAAKVVVEAKCGWINGLSPNDDYRRIVFFIYSGNTTVFERPEVVGGWMPQNYYKCYWLIDEMTRLTKPATTK